MKCEVPGGKPRILPLVGHGEDAHGIQMAPVDVANVLCAIPAAGSGIIAIEPEIHVEEIRLLVPEHARERLALDQAVVRVARRADGSNRRIRRLPVFVAATIVSTSASGSRPRETFLRRAQAHGQDERSAGRDLSRVVKARLRAHLLGVDAILAVNHVAMERIFHVWLAARVALAENARAIRFVVGEKKFGARRAVEAQ